MQHLKVLTLMGLLLAGTQAMTTDEPDDMSPTTEETPDAGSMTCKFNENDDKSCVGGCFGLINEDQAVSTGCIGDLDFAGSGFTVTTCGDDEKNGRCMDALIDGETVEVCMGCCTDSDNCNEKYIDLCSFPSTADKCALITTTDGAAEKCLSLSLFMLTMVLLKFF
ncbi:uncharacterized protein [Watersipora subatra]|uniref:uncharacterized protein n=1 Tax=Watersipora subatra TaxID=2589382 RepID=UPI00355C8EEA